jgi:hypothetical protein
MNIKHVLLVVLTTLMCSLAQGAKASESSARPPEMREAMASALVQGYLQGASGALAAREIQMAEDAPRPSYVLITQAALDNVEQSFEGADRESAQHKLNAYAGLLLSRPGVVSSPLIAGSVFWMEARAAWLADWRTNKATCSNLAANLAFAEALHFLELKKNREIQHNQMVAGATACLTRLSSTDLASFRTATMSRLQNSPLIQWTREPLSEGQESYPVEAPSAVTAFISKVLWTSEWPTIREATSGWPWTLAPVVLGLLFMFYGFNGEDTEDEVEHLDVKVVAKPGIAKIRSVRARRTRLKRITRQRKPTIIRY